MAEGKSAGMEGGSRPEKAASPFSPGVPSGTPFRVILDGIPESGPCAVAVERARSANKPKTATIKSFVFMAASCRESIFVQQLDQLRAYTDTWPAGKERECSGEAHCPGYASEKSTLWLALLYHTLVTFRLILG
jgi:hypothetical protein